MGTRFEARLLFTAFTECPVQGQGDVVNEWYTTVNYPDDGSHTKVEMIRDAIEDSGYSAPRLGEIEPEWMDGSFQYGWLVDSDNYEADAEDVDLFNKGKKTLYSLNVTVELFKVVETQITDLLTD